MLRTCGCDPGFDFREFFSAMLSDPASLASVLGVLWVFSFFVYAALLLVLRLLIEPHAPVFSEVFEDRISARWPVRMLQFKYLLPWIPAPVELGRYSVPVRILFFVTRIVWDYCFRFPHRLLCSRILFRQLASPLMQNPFVATGSREASAWRLRSN